MTFVARFVVAGKPVPKWMRTDPRTRKRYLHPDSRAYMAKVRADAQFAARWEAVDEDLRRRVPAWPSEEDCARCRPTRRAGRKPKCACAFCSSTIRMDVVIYFPDRRVRDRDNVLKGIQDACNRVLYRDDTQIEDGLLQKRIDRANPRVEILVTLEPPPQTGLALEEPELELVPCDGCEGTGGFDVTLPVSGKKRTVVCGDCGGSGTAPK